MTEKEKKKKKRGGVGGGEGDQSKQTKKKGRKTIINARILLHLVLSHPLLPLPIPGDRNSRPVLLVVCPETNRSREGGL